MSGKFLVSLFFFLSLKSAFAMGSQPLPSAGGPANHYFYQKKASELNPIRLQTADGSLGFINDDILDQASSLLSQKEFNSDGSVPLLLPPHFAFEDARLLTPFLSFASRIKKGIKRESQLKSALNVFSPKKLAQLVKAADAVGSEALLDLASTVLAEKLKNPELLDRCLEAGSYELDLEDNSSTSRIAQKMFQNSAAHSYWLLKEQVATHGKHNEPPCRYSNEKKYHIWNADQSDLVATATAPAYAWKSLLNERYTFSVSDNEQQPVLTITDLRSNKVKIQIKWPHADSHPRNFLIDEHKNICMYSVFPDDGRNGAIWVRGLHDGAVIKKFTHAKNSLFSLAIDARGEKIAAAPVGDEIQLWDLATDEQIVLSGHDKKYVLDVSFNSKGTQLVSAGGFDETVRIWDTETSACIKNFSFHKGPVFQAHFINHDNQILTVHIFEICIWDIASGTLVQTIKNYPYDNIKLGYRPSEILLNKQTNLLASIHNYTWSSTAQARLHTLFTKETDRYLARDLTLEQAALLLAQFNKKVTRDASSFPVSCYAGINKIVATYHNPAIAHAFMKTTSWKEWIGLKIANWTGFFQKP